jgi:branched-chain amino acid transport system ATP-binding protein
MPTIILRGGKISKNFGGLKAINNLSFELEENKIYGLIGPNGAGKTTLFNLITGFQSVDNGKIYFEEKDITNLSPIKINRLGIARTFQVPKPYRSLTVFENVYIGALFGNERNKSKDPKKIAEEMIEFIELKGKENYYIHQISIFEIKKLEIARALATRPKLLLVDEACSGLTGTEISQMLEFFRRIKNMGITEWLIEHDMKAIMNISDRIIVLEDGRKLAEGTPDEVSKNQEVIQAYLGEEYARSK